MNDRDKGVEGELHDENVSPIRCEGGKQIQESIRRGGNVWQSGGGELARTKRKDD